MGLDVHAYSKLEYLEAQPFEEEEIEAAEASGAKRLYNANGFFRLHPQQEGYYKLLGEDQHIKCGAYSRYSRWRENLARLTGWPLDEYERYGKMWPSHAESAFKAKSGPFWELICFGDNEGSIGAENSAKLAVDFAHYQKSIAERALLMEDGGVEFMNFYTQWAAAFALAANDGAVKFQ